MPRLFISHSSKDNVEALAFQRWLSANGWSSDDVFIDLHSIGAGERWRDTLRKANASAEAVILLASPDSLESVECQKELELAEALGKEIIVAILRDLDRNDPRLARYNERQFVDLSTEPTERMEPLEYDGRLHRAEFNMAALGAIKTRLTNLGIAPGSFAWPPRGVPNPEPFPGLSAFGEDEAGIFFGRDADIMSALTEIRIIRRRRTPRLIVIDAASGAGKSSFLRAGLWPRLRRDPDFAPLAILRPAQGIITGPDGLGRGLGNYFERHGKSKTPGMIHSSVAVGDVVAGAAALAALLADATVLATEARRAGQDDARPPAPVIAIDQAEELFSAENEVESRHFLALLAQVLKDPPEDVDPYVILTIRADSVQSLLTRIAELGLETPKALYLPPLSPLAYRDVIVKPAEVYAERVRRLTLEPTLVNALVDDAAGADALPLLAFTLSQLFANYAPAGQLTLEQYREMGGASGSIGRALKGAIARAGATGTAENLRRLVVPRLATWDPDADQAKGAAKRVVATLDSVIGGERASLAPLVNTLVTARLLMQSRDTLEVAHEALLRQPPISDWLEENREFLVWRDRLARERASFETNHRGHLVGRELQIARDWLKTRAADDVAAADRQFVLDSVAEDDRRRTVEEEKEEKRREAELAAAQALAQAAQERAAASRRVVRRTVAGLVGALVFAVLASGAGIYAWQQRQEAVAQQQVAVAERKKADEERKKADEERARADSERDKAVEQASRAEDARTHAEAMTKSVDEARRDAQINQSRFLADFSRQATAQGDAVTGMLLALAGLPDAKSPDEVTRARAYWAPTEVSLEHARRMMREERVLAGHTDVVNAIAMMPDGSRFVTGSSDDTVRIWDVSSGVEVAKLEGHRGNVTSVVVTRDGLRIVSGSEDRTVRIWDATTGKEIGQLSGHSNRVGSVAVSPDGSRIVAGTDDNVAVVWDAEKRTRLFDLRDHSDWVRSVAFYPDGSRIVTGSHDGTVRIWDAQTGVQTDRLAGGAGQIDAVAVLPDGRIVIGGADNTVRFMDRAAGKESVVARGHTGRVNGLTVMPDGSRILSASADGTVRHWDARTGAHIATFSGHVGALRAVAVKPDGAQFVAGGVDQTVRTWSTWTTPEALIIRGHASDVNGVTFTPDGSRIISTSDDETIRVWDAGTGAFLTRLQGHSGFVLDAVVMPDGKSVVSASTDNSIRIWDLDTGRETKRLQGHTSAVNGLTLIAKGGTIVSASQDGSIRLWDAADGTETKRLEARGGPVLSVAPMMGGNRIVTGSDDRTARIWDAATGKEIRPLKGNTASVWKVLVTRDGGRVVTGATDGMIRIFDTRSGLEIAQLKGHANFVYGLALTPDESRLVSGSWDDTVRVWDLHPSGEVLIQKAKAAVPRCLTPAERERYYLPPEPPLWCQRGDKWPYDAVGALNEATRLLRANKAEEDREAEVLLSTLVNRDPGANARANAIRANAYLDRGVRLLDNAKDEEAKGQFARAMELDAGIGPAIEERWVSYHSDRGRRLLEEGKEEEAIAQFRLALERAPGAAARVNGSWARALVTLGERHLRDGKQDEASARFAQAIERDPGTARQIDEIWVSAQISRGERLILDGRTEEAGVWLARALERDAGASKRIDEMWVTAHISRGQQLVQEGKDEEAKAPFAQAIERDRSAAGRVELAWISGERQRGDRLLSQAREAKEEGERRARRTEAVTVFDSAVKRAQSGNVAASTLRDALFDRGRANDTAQNYVAAVADFRRAIELGRQRTDDWLFWSVNRLGEQLRDDGKPIEGLLLTWRNFLDLNADLANRISIRSLKATWAMRHGIGGLSGDLLQKERQAEPTECDRLASHRNDPMRIAAWVDFNSIKPEVALPACEQAVAQHPNEPRFLFMRGRVHDRAARLARLAQNASAAKAGDAAARADYESSMRMGYVWAFNNYAGLLEDGQGIDQDEAKAADVSLENFNRLMHCCWTRVARHLIAEADKHDAALVHRVVRDLTRWSAALGSDPARMLIAELTSKGVLLPEAPLPAAGFNDLPPWLRF